MRNIFDQYDQEENRVTFALLLVLSSSQRLTRRFVREVAGVRRIPPGPILVRAQAKTAQTDTVPDGMITHEDGAFGIAIESKIVPASVRVGQLRGHLAHLRGYDVKRLLVLTPDDGPPRQTKSLGHTRWLSWAQVYGWIRKQQRAAQEHHSRSSFLLDQFREYLEMHEGLSEFHGVSFDGGFDEDRAREYLRTLMHELAPTANRLFGRQIQSGKIRASWQGGVWSWFGQRGFTKDLHLTLFIGPESLMIALTLPDKAARRWTQFNRLLARQQGKKRFERMICDLRGSVPRVILECIQRHWPMRSRSVIDAHLVVDVDTLPFSGKRKGIRKLDVWYDTVLCILDANRKANVQFMIQCHWPYQDPKAGRKVSNRSFLKEARNTMTLLQPIYDWIRK